MNIAITMSGVSRYPEKSYLNLKDQIITPLQDKDCNVKVFIHTWDTKTVIDQKWGNDDNKNNKYENDFKLSKEWYKKNKDLNIKDIINNIIDIEDFLIEDNKSYTETFNKILSNLPTPNMMSPFNLISSLYSKYKVFLLKLWDSEIKKRIPDFTLIGPPKLTNIIDNIYNVGLNKYIKNRKEFNPHTLISTIINKQRRAIFCDWSYTRSNRFSYWWNRWYYQ